MEPELFKAFCDEFTREVNRLRIERRTDQDAWRSELTKVEKQIRGIIAAIKDGMYQSSMKAEMDALEARKAELDDRLANAEEPPPLLHPNMAEIYRQRITAPAGRGRKSRGCGGLPHAGRSGDARARRGRVGDRVGRRPGRDPDFCSGQEKPDFLSEAGLLGDLVSPVSVVAGRRNHRCRHSLQVAI
jgi:hypothetical protein